MSELSIHERLDRLYEEIQKRSFVNHRAPGGEVNFHIFDYEPEHELLIRDYVLKLILQLAKPENNLPTLEINLFQMALDILNERKFLDKALQLESKKGKEALHKALKPLLRPEKLSQIISEKLRDEHKLVLLTGIGEAWPLIRSHSILNNLHDTVDRLPLIVFFPGSYDGHELSLFSTIHDDNYYRGECPENGVNSFSS